MVGGPDRAQPAGVRPIDPRFQVKVAGAGSRPSDEAWWDVEVRDDIHDFLATYLTTTDAAVAPCCCSASPAPESPPAG